MKEKLAKLIDVKSIITILFALSFIIMCFTKTNDAMVSALIDLVKMIVVFYFGTQVAKGSQSAKKEGE